MSQLYVVVHVFSRDGTGGNPLAVFPDAAGFDPDAMQAIAARLGLSETVFVHPPADPRHTAALRIFTPAQELPFAGHPTIGAGFVLAERGVPGEHYTFELPAGLTRVQPQRAAGRVSGAAVAAPHSLQIGIEVPAPLVLACAGLHEGDLRTDAHGPLVASVGTEFVVAELRDLAALQRATPHQAAFHSMADAHPQASTLCLYVRREGDATHLRQRVFAPLLGVAEDPATGSAAAALCALLTALAPGDDVDLHFAIEQGIEMGRSSLILGQSRKAAEGPVTARVAGECTMVETRALDA